MRVGTGQHSSCTASLCPSKKYSPLFSRPSWSRPNSNLQWLPRDFPASGAGLQGLNLSPKLNKQGNCSHGTFLLLPQDQQSHPSHPGRQPRQLLPLRTSLPCATSKQSRQSLQFPSHHLATLCAQIARPLQLPQQTKLRLHCNY